MKSASKKENKLNDVKATSAAIAVDDVAHHRRDFSALLYRALKIMTMSIETKTFTKKNVQRSLDLFEAIAVGANGDKYSIQAWSEAAANKVFAAMSRFNEPGVLYVTILLFYDLEINHLFVFIEWYSPKTF
jgi:hypothetical protein